MANQGIDIDVFVNLQKAISDTVKGSKVMAASMAKNIAGPLNAVATVSYTHLRAHETLRYRGIPGLL